MKKALVAVVILISLAAAQQKRGRRGPDSGIFHTDVPAHRYDLILCRAEAEAVTASVLAYEDLEGYIEYGAGKTEAASFPKGKPVEIALKGLHANSAYTYRLRFRAPGASSFEQSEEYTFHTQRAPGAAFTFAVQADSHLDENVSPDVYTRTLLYMAAAALIF